MCFNLLDILSGRQSLLSSQYVPHKSSSSSNVLGYGKSSLKRSSNKLNFALQLTFLQTKDPVFDGIKTILL